jgi:hypothetical protein
MVVVFVALKNIPMKTSQNLINNATNPLAMILQCAALKQLMPTPFFQAHVFVFHLV